jgi:hypothetical protein
MLQRWPTLRAIWSTSFVAQAWEQGRLPLWLSDLRDNPTDIELLKDIARLEGWLKRLSAITGFDRLAAGIKSRATMNWSHTYLEVDVLQHWESTSLLEEIQPQVPMDKASADFRLCFEGTDVWGEITQFEALKKARLPHGVTKLLSPEEELRRIPSLMRKLRRQLPPESVALAIINARRTIQRIETWERSLPEIFDNLPNVAGIVVRGRVVTRFYGNHIHGHLAKSLKRKWGDYQLR